MEASRFLLRRLGGLGVGDTAMLGCTGVPARAICSVRASVNVNATQASSITATVTTAPHNAGLGVIGSTRCKIRMVVGDGILTLAVRPGVSTGSRFSLRMLPFALLLLICSCGGGSSGSPTQSGARTGNYTLTVTATIGSATQSLPLTLIVQ